MLYSLRLLLSARPMLQLQHSWSTFLSGTVEEAERDMAGLKIIVTTIPWGTLSKITLFLVQLHSIQRPVE